MVTMFTAGTAATGAAIASAASIGAALGAIECITLAGGVAGTFWAAAVGADSYTWDCWKPVVLSTPSRVKHPFLWYDVARSLPSP